MTASTLRVAAQFAQAGQRSCPQCLRSFSSYKPYLSYGKRKIQTASALHPQSFEPPPPPPRNTFNPTAPITKDTGSKSDAATITSDRPAKTTTTVETQTSTKTTAQSSSTSTATPTENKRPRQFKFAPRKATIKLSPTAVDHVRALLDQPEPKLLRIGTKNKGCSGLAYHLEYVDKPGKFDETVEQDGVKVLIESRTLLHIIGSEMDWVEDKLSARFVFKNPNISKFRHFLPKAIHGLTTSSAEQCGCGESFSIS